MLETESLQGCVEHAREAAPSLAALDSATKNRVLLELADELEREYEAVLRANQTDMAAAEAAGMEPAMLDRLLLTPERLVAMAGDVRHVANLPDPVGEEFDARVLPNGLRVCRRRVPLGVIGVIYEARPNVTIDVAVLCLKSGNPVILRGGKEAMYSNHALAEIVRTALRRHDAPADAAQLIRDPDRALVGEMIRMQGAIDLIVPRGGAGLIDFVHRNALVPVVTGGIGVCHTYVHGDADLDQALDIVDNAKRRRPTICNALDTVLVHRAVADFFLPALAERWADPGVEMRCDPAGMEILERANARGARVPAHEDDFGREFLSLRAAVRVVNDLDEAIAHIQRYGSGHSEAIITDGYAASREFVNRIDAAAVYVNASTQFTDGAQLGLGAELGISTQKFHARGPLGLRELTSYKWVVLGDGQIRP